MNSCNALLQTTCLLLNLLLLCSCAGSLAYPSILLCLIVVKVCIVPHLLERLESLLPDQHDDQVALALLGALKQLLVNLLDDHLLVDRVRRFLRLATRIRKVQRRLPKRSRRFFCLLLRFGLIGQGRLEIFKGGTQPRDLVRVRILRTILGSRVKIEYIRCLLLCVFFL